MSRLYRGKVAPIESSNRMNVKTLCRHYNRSVYQAEPKIAVERNELSHSQPVRGLNRLGCKCALCEVAQESNLGYYP